MTFPARIYTKNLKMSDVPGEHASWKEITTFALTFDPKERDPYHLPDRNLQLLTNATGLIELRAYLFFEQRRWNHFGRMPDDQTMEGIKHLISLIREMTKANESSNPN